MVNQKKTFHRSAGKGFAKVPGRTSEQGELAAFEGEEFLLDREASAVSGEFAAAADDAVAGDDDRDGIGAVGQAYGTRCVGVADASGKFPVGDGFSVRDAAETLPDGLLERRALRGEGEVEGFKLPGEVGAQLADGVFQGARIFLPGGVGGMGALAALEIDAAESGVVGHEQERSDGAL